MPPLHSAWMRPSWAPLWIWIGILALWVRGAPAQDLEPRAYSVSPVGTSFAVFTTGQSRGSVVTDPTLPIEDVSAVVNVLSMAYFRSFDFFGRSANFTAALPYGWGRVEGLVLGEPGRITRSGLVDARFRVAFNLKGAPAMHLREFMKYRHKTVIGTSLVIIAPTGQYDPAKIVNLGTNRWTFKPEFGFSRALGESGRWLLDAYGGVWFFTANNDYRGGTKTQDPMLTTQLHLNYLVRPRFWASVDTTFYAGGRGHVDGVPQANQRNLRIGTTISIPIHGPHSLKFSASTGAVVRTGGDFNTFGFAYQYLWNPKP